VSIDPLRHFAQVWCVDTEYRAPAGESPTVHCLVGRELRSGKLLRLWCDDLADIDRSPIPTGPEVLFVCYYAAAELGAYLALGWPLPERVLDLCAEFKCATSGLQLPHGRDLLGAMAAHGLTGIGAVEKKDMRDLAIRGGPFTSQEQSALLDYCQSDVDALVQLLPAMLPRVDIPRALLRGRYMSAVARMERTGIPLDVETLSELREYWPQIKQSLVDRVDQEFGVYEGLSFRTEKFANYLISNNIAWPRLDSGALRLDGDTFKDMAKVYPHLSPLRELRHSLSELRLESLACGEDGRNRCMLSAFKSMTGRNQPSNAKYIFGPSTWLRGLIKPTRGRSLAYIDWSQQEFAIAAALSGDSNMITAYRSGDPYLAFAVQAGAAPPDATKHTHGAVRELFKVCALMVQYGVGSDSLATRLNVAEPYARDLLRLHRETYPRFWEWSESAVEEAMLHSRLSTVFGWRVHVGPENNPRSLQNFPMQANGAEMLRIACCLATERGVRVCGPIHDALLIEASTDGIEDAVRDCRGAMAEASAAVLGGLELRTDVNVVTWPERYSDPRGAQFWATLMDLVGDLKRSVPNLPRVDAGGGGIAVPRRRNLERPATPTWSDPNTHLERPAPPVQCYCL
jgi:DNA polymerase-1